VMATALNSDVLAQKTFSFRVIWDHQLYELDVFGIPAGDPKKKAALDFILAATGSAPLAGVASWAGLGPARRSSLPLVKANPETGADMRPGLPTAPQNFKGAFAIDETWWLAHQEAIMPRWQEFVSR